MRAPPSNPPRPGIRRKIDEVGVQTFDQPHHRAKFATQVETIHKCGLAAEVHCDGNWLTLYAVRRVRTLKRDE